MYEHQEGGASGAVRKGELSGHLGGTERGSAGFTVLSRNSELLFQEGAT